MKLKVFTLSFSSEVNGFDDSSMQTFLSDKHVVEVTDHFFFHEKVPYMSLLVAYRDIEGLEYHSHSRKNDPRTGLDPSEQQAYDALRAWRAATARQEGIPPYVIMNNRQVAECVKIQARTRADLARIRGLGEAKVSQYGDMILEILATHAHGKSRDIENQDQGHSHDS